MKITKESNFPATLQSGFKKSGIFPFDADIIRKTVKISVPNTATTSAIGADDGRLLSISKLLTDIRLSSSDLKDCVDFIHRKLRGEPLGKEVAKAARIVLAPAPKPKKVKKTDQRIRIEDGRNLTQSDTLSFLEERIDKKNALRTKKVTRAPLSLAERVPAKASKTVKRSFRKKPKNTFLGDDYDSI